MMINARTALCLAPAFALVALILSGCNIGQKSSPSRFYVLSALPQETESLPQFDESPPNVGVSQVEVPGYIDRPQITYRVGENQIAFSEFNRWGEPIGTGVTRVLRQNLTELMGAGKVTAFPWMQPYPRNVTLSATITDFGANANGTAQLSVIYRLSDASSLDTYFVREAIFVDSDGGSLDTTNAVAAMSRLMGDFAEAAAQDIAMINREERANEASADDESE